jgi:HAMP domain-containing protein
MASGGKFAVTEAARELVPDWPAGQTVTCPKCGKPGTASFTTARGSGGKYVYRVVWHSATERCLVPGAVARVTESGEVVPLTPKGKAAKAKTKVEAGAGRVEAPPARAAETARLEAVAEEGELRRVVEEVRRLAESLQPVEAAKAEALPEWEDKAWWYALKVAKSEGAFTEEPTEERFTRFVNTVYEVGRRVGVPAPDVISAAQYFRLLAESAKRGEVSWREADKAKAVLNEATKLFMRRVYQALRPKEGEAAAPAVARLEELAAKLEAAASKLEELASRVAEASAKPAAQPPDFSFGPFELDSFWAVYVQKKKGEVARVAAAHGRTVEEVKSAAKAVKSAVVEEPRRRGRVLVELRA